MSLPLGTEPKDGLQDTTVETPPRCSTPCVDEAPTDDTAAALDVRTPEDIAADVATDETTAADNVEAVASCDAPRCPPALTSCDAALAPEPEEEQKAQDVQPSTPIPSRTVSSPRRSCGRRASKMGWRQPEPLELPQVWICVPRSSSLFQRCRLCVDKLGLTLLPLMAQSALPRSDDARSVQEVLWRGAVVSQPEEELALMTQMISLQTSAVKSIIEDSTEAARILLDESMCVDQTPSWRRPFSRVILAGSRAMFGQSAKEQAIEQKSADQSTAAAAARTASDTEKTDILDNMPHPHLVGLYVDGAVVKAAPRYTFRLLSDQERSEMEVALSAKREPRPVYLAVCFKTVEEACALARQLRKFRRYAFSLPSWPSNVYVPAASPLSSPRDESAYVEREGAALGLEPGEVDAVLNALSPPPPDDPYMARKRVPSLSTSTDGQIFWRAPVNVRSTPKRKVHLFQLASI